MSEQILMPILHSGYEESRKTAQDLLEQARASHEKYLIGLNNSDLQDAVSKYIDAVKYDPSIPETYYRLASLMWEQGQISVNSAIEQCKTAVSLNPDNVNAHLYTGYFMQIAQDYDSAEFEFKSAIKNNVLNSGRPRMILSQSILQKISAHKATIKDYASFLYYFVTGSVMLAWDIPTMKMFYRNISNDVSIFSHSSAGRFFEKFKMYDYAKKVYADAIEKTNGKEFFYEKMADLALLNEDTDETVQCYRNVLENNPMNREILVKLVSVLQAYYPENTQDAIDCYERLLEFKIDTAQIYYELGHLYMGKGDKINSISAFKLALDNDEDNPFYNNSLAYAYAKAELYDDAIEYYKKAIALNPDPEWTSIVCHALGSIYAGNKENFEAAISTYQAGIILDPENYDLYISLGDLYMGEYDVDNAIRSYCDAVTLDPDNERGYTKLGVALWEKDYLEEALVAYHKAVEINPENSFSLNNLGILYLDGLADAKEALSYFEDAIHLNPNYMLAYFNAGRACQELGHTNEAANYYQMALDLNRLNNEIEEDDIVNRLHSLFEI